MMSISAFTISLFGIISLLYFRLWEVRRGEQLFAKRRREFDTKLISLREHIKSRIPTLDQKVIFRIYHTIVHYFALVVLFLVKVIERRMVSLLEHVRGKREVTKGVTKSEFLRQVKDHKKSLERPQSSSVE